MRILYSFLSLVLFGFQVFLITKGGWIFGKFLNPVLLCLVSVAIPLIAFRQTFGSNVNEESKHQSKSGTYLWISGGIFSFLLTYEEYRKIWVEFFHYGNWSDVVKQVLILYNRFSNGVFPYTPIPFPGHSLEPIYMPFHWLPVGLGQLFAVDPRWIGWAFLVIAGGFWGWAVSKLHLTQWHKGVVLVLPSVAMWGFILWAKPELTISYELVVAAYYALLAVGLLKKNVWLITIGVILCLLSRFTLVFWVPVLMVIAYDQFGWKKTLLHGSVILMALIAFYIIPFYLPDPQALQRGLQYYTNATVGDWIGIGSPAVSWTQEGGVSFAGIFNHLMQGEAEGKVKLTRYIQIVTLFVAIVFFILTYYKRRYKIAAFHYLLISLYSIMLVYFFFAPLTYRYYLFPFSMVSAGVVALCFLRKESVRPVTKTQ